MVTRPAGACDHGEVFIVADTSIFADDYHLRTTLLRLLIEHCKAAGHQLVVPEVVILEIVNRYRERIEERREKLLNAAKAVKEATRRDFEISYSAAELNSDVDGYEHWLRTEITSYGGMIRPIPAMAHEAVIRRDLSRRKPFQRSGKGYRDALIWETVLELATLSQDVAFLSMNTEDFAEKDGALHHELREDLEKRGLPKTSVRLYTTLKSFVDQQVIASLPKPHQDLARFTLEKAPHFSLTAAVEQVALDRLPYREVRAWVLGRRHEIEIPTITQVGSAANIVVEDQRELDSGERIIKFSADIVECLFDCYVEKGEFTYLREEEGLSLADPDWNEHYVVAQFYDTIRITGYMTLSGTDGRVTSSEISDIAGTPRELMIDNRKPA